MLRLKSLGRPVLLIAALVLIGAGVRDIDPRRYGLAAPRLVGSVAFETIPSGEELAAYVVELRIERTMTWEELGDERGLSPALLEETYACSVGGRTRTYTEIKYIKLEPPKRLQVVLRSGACAARGKR